MNEEPQAMYKPHAYVIGPTAGQCEVCSYPKSDYVHTVADMYARIAKAHAVAEKLMELSRSPVPSVMALRACADVLRSL